MSQRTALWCGMFAMACLLATTGCGAGSSAVSDPGIKTQGQLLQGGQPASIENYQSGYTYYELTFVPVGGGKGTTTDVESDGRFDLQGISAGKYRVGITKFVDANEAEWDGKVDAQKSALEVDVAEGQPITVDMDKLVAE